jgi:hypothetical protein
MYFYALLEIFKSKLYWVQMIGIHPKKEKNTRKRHKPNQGSATSNHVSATSNHV